MSRGRHAASRGLVLDRPRRGAAGLLASLLVVGVVSVAPLPAHAQASSLTPLADAYVDAADPGRNFGEQGQLRVDGQPTRTSYLKFDIGRASRTAGAMLRLFVESENNDLTGIVVRQVADDSWTERKITAANAPAVGGAMDSTGPLRAGSYYYLDVSAALSGDSILSLALTSEATTAVRISSREGAVAPRLYLPPPPPPTRFSVSRAAGGSYRAVADIGTEYTGSLKHVVESAVHDLGQRAGGTVVFAAGDFDLGSDFLHLRQIEDIVFQGAGMDATRLRNSSDAAADTEPFNVSGADRVVIRDLEVHAGGAPRTTSDAIDFDQGNDNVVERVRIVRSRGRGIVFDGKNDSWTADRNRVSDCVIAGTHSKGIELLASSSNRIERCQITDAGGVGIHVNKASSVADQANKTSDSNTIVGNVVLRAGGDGISVNGGRENVIVGNRVVNSSTLSTGRDGIRITSMDGVSVEDTVVRDNVATDDRVEKRQNYGLKIHGPLCVRTVVSGNDFAGNRLADVSDTGTDTRMS